MVSLNARYSHGNPLQEPSGADSEVGMDEDAAYHETARQPNAVQPAT